MTTTEVEAIMAAAPVPGMPQGNTPWASRYAGDLRQVIVRQASRQPRSRQQFLGPSELGSDCDRQVVGKMISAPVTNHIPDPWPSIVGTAVHAWLAEKFQMENELNGTIRWLTETRVSPDPQHPGTADLFDLLEAALVDWKILGPTSIDKVRSPGGPSRRYRVQLLLYALGFRNYGARVDRIALVALPRTAATLDAMYIWEHPVDPVADNALIAEVLRVTGIRRMIAAEILKGGMRLKDVPFTPDEDECFYCPLYRRAAVRDGVGCPGTAALPRPA
jgi:hypothetical protein